MVYFRCWVDMGYIGVGKWSFSNDHRYRIDSNSRHTICQYNLTLIYYRCIWSRTLNTWIIHHYSNDQFIKINYNKAIYHSISPYVLNNPETFYFNMSYWTDTIPITISLTYISKFAYIVYHLPYRYCLDRVEHPLKLKIKRRLRLLQSRNLGLVGRRFWRLIKWANMRSIFYDHFWHRWWRWKEWYKLQVE